MVSAEDPARRETLLLTARGLPASERADFLRTACGDDDELRQELERELSEAPTELPPRDREAAEPAGGLAAGERVGPWRVLKRIGRGGMGVVYLAERADGEYEKRAALKLMKRDLDSELVIRMFRQERQILAGLDHPNIARLLDGGASAQGSPYFVMEYVEGEPIDKHCARLNLSTAERVDLFRPVCAAVQFAHQNLVVHRDLKPSNILVTADGVPKLLDFGIAKVLKPEAGVTQTATTWVLTPFYASPEQVAARQVTTASDVYSLGVILYELLCRQRPYDFPNPNPLEFVRVINEVDPEHPSARVADARTRRELSGDLDTIVLKALRKEPARRYASAQQLAEDLERWGRGLPVQARRDTLGYRASKFIYRHKGGMAAAAVVALSLLGGIVATFWQAKVARDQGARAERRFNDVRKLAHSLLFEIHDEIQDLAGATRARELLVKRALEYLDSLVQESGDDPALQAELAEAYQRVGDVQGRPGFANLGDRSGAIESYRKALALREALAARGRSGAALEVATTLDRIGDTLRTLGDSRGALESYRRALKQRESLPTGASQARDVATSYQRMADMLAATGEPRGAVDFQQRALALLEEISLRQPAEPVVGRDLFIARVKLGDRYMAAGDASGALPLYRKALAASQAVAERDPTSARARRELAVCHDKVGNALLESGAGKAARAEFQSPGHPRSARRPRSAGRRAAPRCLGEPRKVGPEPPGRGRLGGRSGQPPPIACPRRGFPARRSRQRSGPSGSQLHARVHRRRLARRWTSGRGPRELPPRP
jgi:non-specific serine/threonine protein kinase/serine/threonine-protein kinase